MRASVVPLLLVVSVLAALAPCVSARAEVVALRTGERVDCTVQSVSATQVTIDVAGDTLVFPREEVAAIYLSVPGRQGTGSPLSDAVQVLKGLQSAVRGGADYRDYSRHVTAAQGLLRGLLAEAADGPTKQAVADALAFYVFASEAWKARNTNSNFDQIGANPLIEKCEPLREEVVEGLRRIPSRGIKVAFLGMESIFGCASDRLLVAETLLREP